MQKILTVNRCSISFITSKIVSFEDDFSGSLVIIGIGAVEHCFNLLEAIEASSSF